MSILSRLIDERFLTHRRWSTSIAGQVGGVLAVCLFAYRYYIDHLWSWDLLTVCVTIVAVKMAAMAWCLLRG